MKKKDKLIPVWIWDRTVEDFVRERIKGYSLNVCAGMSPLGDVKLDLDPKDISILKGDMRNLPYPDNTFDTVIQDPPWKIGFYERMKPFFECVRVCKIGGRIIYNAYWLPQSVQTNLDEVYCRYSEWGNVSIISVFTKKNMPIIS